MITHNVIVGNMRLGDAVEIESTVWQGHVSAIDRLETTYFLVHWSVAGWGDPPLVLNDSHIFGYDSQKECWLLKRSER